MDFSEAEQVERYVEEFGKATAANQGPAAARGHRGRYHADRRAQFNQERLGRTRPTDEAEQEGPPDPVREQKAGNISF